MTEVPFLDLRAQYLTIQDEIREALDAVLESTSFVLGPAVEMFETEFARFVDANHAVAASSGTSALQLAMLAAGIGDGDEVIAPAMTFVATVAAIEYTGARPVLVDVDPRTYTIDPEQIEAVITPRTRAVIPVHLYGQPADMDAVTAIARKHDLIVIEDAAQAHGAEYAGRRCGSIGDMAAFSFYPGKNLGAYGEGGAVTTDRSDFAAAVRMLRDWGQKKKYHHEVLGYNYRMDGFQGAVLAVKMKHIEAWTEARRGVAARYGELLSELDEVTLPVESGRARHVYHVYPVLLENRDMIRKSLEAAGIATGIHYPLPVHLQACFADLPYERGDFPVGERLAKKELSLPMFPELTEHQIDAVCRALRHAVRIGARRLRATG